MSDTPDPLALVEELERLLERIKDGRASASSNPESWLSEEDYHQSQLALRNFCSEDNLRSLCEAVRAARKDAERMDVIEEWCDDARFTHERGLFVSVKLGWFVGDGGGTFWTEGATWRECADKALELAASPIGPKTP